MLTARLTIGVLALQGDFDAHRRRLEELGAEVVLVKRPEQLDQIDGLIIPGGESGTFAGAILLASEVENPPQAGLGALAIRIRRNAYGRQIDSSIREGKFFANLANNNAGSPLEMVFIRAH